MPTVSIPQSRVWIVDIDKAHRERIHTALKTLPLDLAEVTPPDLLELHDGGRPGAIVISARLPYLNPSTLINGLNKKAITTPVIVLTAPSQAHIGVQARRLGARDLLEKPVDPDLLRTRVLAAITADLQAKEAARTLSRIRRCHGRLTTRERQVLRLVTRGLRSKEIADRLGVGRRTVEQHRAHLMHKMECRSITELVDKVLLLEEAGPEDSDQAAFAVPSKP